MPFFTAQQLGPRQSMTPDGYLLCEAVPIARTGDQLYGASELPLEPASDQLIRVRRVDADVFRAETMASFEGKPVTMGHPADFVSPDNWNELAVGHAQNVRRGDGAESDLLVADLLITNAEAIAAVRDGLREVSCGYEADYESAGGGTYYQRNIIGNHVALVERGRAGARCAIQDEEPDPMKTKDQKKPSGLFGRLLLALRAKDEDGLMQTLEALDDDEETEEEKKAREEADRAKTGDALAAQVAALAKTVDSLAATVKAMAKDSDDSDEDDDKKTEDEDEETDEEKAERTKTGDALRDVMVKAEILVPGFSMPTVDSVKSPADVVALQRRVLGAALKTDDGAKIVNRILSGKTVDKLSDEAVSIAFNAASLDMGQANNSRGERRTVNTKDFGKVPPTAAELNASYADFWSKRI